MPPEDGKLETLHSSKVETNPAFILKHHSLDIVYMTTEVIDRGNLTRSTKTTDAIAQLPKII